MRTPILALTTLILGTMTAGVLNSPPVLAKPAKVTTNSNSAVCPYLNQSKDKDTASTKATYDPQSKILEIQVARSVPDMFWGVAESMTRDRVTKILQQCPTITVVKVSFQSGQKIVMNRVKLEAKGR